MNETAYRPRRWTRQEYDRLILLGVLDEDDPIELLEGRMVVAEPQNDPHAKAIELVVETLGHALGRGWRVRVQLPMALGDDSEPEPDVVVIRGAVRDAPAGHPTTADLIVEVADSSVRFDRGSKARVYAREGIADYWILNLADRVLEVHRDPRGGRRPKYATVQIARAGETMTPLAAPHARIAVDDLLP